MNRQQLVQTSQTNRDALLNKVWSIHGSDSPGIPDPAVEDLMKYASLLLPVSCNFILLSSTQRNGLQIYQNWHEQPDCDPILHWFPWLVCFSPNITVVMIPLYHQSNCWCCLEQHFHLHHVDQNTLKLYDRSGLLFWKANHSSNSE